MRKSISSELICPVCKSSKLTYGRIHDTDDSSGEIYIPYVCRDCGAEGEEWFALKYRDTRIDLQSPKNIKARESAWKKTDIAQTKTIRRGQRRITAGQRRRT